ncbi:MAG: hypothetical protein O7H41_18805 [Planctomycetota bacterium]|nr:hypothetical protein [Planctomycetota bacterium]
MRSMIALGSILLAAQGCTRLIPFNDPTPIVYEDKVPVRMGYYVSPETMQKIFATRSWAGGIANKWIVYPGQVMDQYCRAYLSGAFDEFVAVPYTEVDVADVDFVVTLDIPEYYLAGYRAHLRLTAEVRDADGRIVYSGGGPLETGVSGAAKALSLGAFGIRSAVRQSTHSAITVVLARIVSDLQSTWKKWTIEPVPDDE